MGRCREALEPPFVQTDAQVIERGAVCIEAFTVRPVYRNKLRNDVDYLTDLCLLFPDLSFCDLAFSDIDHGPDKFPDVARLVQNWVTNVVDVLDRSVRENDSVVRFEVSLRQIRPFVVFRFNRPILRMNPAKKEFGGWSVLPGSNVEYPLHFRRDRDDPR